MKHRLNIIIAIAVALGCITACSQDDAVVPADGSQKAAIPFSVDVGSGSDQKQMTRGYTTSSDVAGYTFIAGDVVSIGVAGNGSSSSRSTTEEVKQYTVSAGTGTQSLTYSCDAGGGSTTGFNWMGTGETLSLRAWSYGNATTPATDPDGQTFSLSTTQNTDASTKELLYSPAASYSYSGGTINISLYHQLARVVVNITGTIPGGITVSSVTIGDGNVPTSATFTKPTSGNNYGSWSAQAGAGSIAAKAETTQSGYQATYSAVVIPAGTTVYAAANRFITIVANQGTYYYNIPAGGLTLQPGRQYTFNITNQNGIICSTVAVSAWTNDAAQELGFK